MEPSVGTRRARSTSPAVALKQVIRSHPPGPAGRCCQDDLVIDAASRIAATALPTDQAGDRARGSEVREARSGGNEAWGASGLARLTGEHDLTR